MSFKERNKMILAKEETTYGTDPTATAAANSILTKNLARRIYGGNQVGRDLDRPVMGNDHLMNTGPIGEITFDVELAGAAAAGVTPQYGALLKACGFSETISAATSVTFAHISSGFDSVTLNFNYDGEEQIFVGCRGNVSLSMTRENIPMLSFRFIGIYKRPTAVAMYDPTWTGITPSPMNDVNTTTHSVHGYATTLSSFSYDVQNDVVYRNLPGFTGVEITDRAPGGAVNIEAPTIAQKDYFAAVESHAGTVVEGAISIVHGAGAGNVCTISVPQSQLVGIEEQVEDKIRHFNMPYRAIPTEAGDDEFSIAFT